MLPIANEIVQQLKKASLLREISLACRRGWLSADDVRNTLNKIKLFHTEISRMIEESVKK